MSRGVTLLASVAVGVLFVGALTGCPKIPRWITEAGTAADTVRVSITGLTVPFSVDPDPVTVGRGFLVEWQHATADSFEIDLRRAPLSPVASRAAGGEMVRAVVVPNAPDGSYKYSITVFVGGQARTDDPRIICCTED